MKRFAFALLLALPLLAAQPPTKELPPGLIVPEAAKPGPAFDAGKATEAYLAVLSDEQRAKSDAYYEGGYWLQLWGLLLLAALTAVLLFGGISRRMRAAAERVTTKPFFVAVLYTLLWVVVMFVLDFPMSVYTGWFREHQYGLSNQTFAAWLGETLKALALELLLVPLVIAGLYTALRRAGRRWWIWASALSIEPHGFATVALRLSTYRKLRPGPIEEVLFYDHPSGYDRVHRAMSWLK